MQEELSKDIIATKMLKDTLQLFAEREEAGGLSKEAQLFVQLHRLALDKNGIAHLDYKNTVNKPAITNVLLLALKIEFDLTPLTYLNYITDLEGVLNSQSESLIQN